MNFFLKIFFIIKRKDEIIILLDILILSSTFANLVKNLDFGVFWGFFWDFLGRFLRQRVDQSLAFRNLVKNYIVFSNKIFRTYSRINEIILDFFFFRNSWKFLFFLHFEELKFQLLNIYIS